MISLDRCDGSCNSFDDPLGRVCVSNKARNANINVFNKINNKNK